MRMNLVYCKNCGHKLNDDANFCLQCGTPVIFDRKSDSLSPLSKGLYRVIQLGAIGSLVLAFFPIHWLLLVASLLLGGASVILSFIHYKNAFIQSRLWFLIMSISGLGLSCYWLIYILIYS